MPTIVVYADIAVDSYRVLYTDPVYNNAREGTGSPSTSGAVFFGTGQALSGGNYSVNQEFLTFDTSILGVGVTINEATLYIFSTGPTPATTTNIEARVPWVAASPFEAVFVPGSALDTKTFVANLATNTVVLNGYIKFQDIALIPNLVLNGDTKLFLASDRQRLNIAPIDTSETAQFSSPDASGTTQDPKLLIVYTLPLAVLGGTASSKYPMQSPVPLTSP